MGDFYSKVIASFAKMKKSSTLALVMLEPRNIPIRHQPSRHPDYLPESSRHLPHQTSRHPESRHHQQREDRRSEKLRTDKVKSAENQKSYREHDRKIQSAKDVQNGHVEDPKRTRQRTKVEGRDRHQSRQSEKSSKRKSRSLPRVPQDEEECQQVQMSFFLLQLLDIGLLLLTPVIEIFKSRL